MSVKTELAFDPSHGKDKMSLSSALVKVVASLYAALDLDRVHKSPAHLFRLSFFLTMPRDLSWARESWIDQLPDNLTHHNVTSKWKIYLIDALGTIQSVFGAKLQSPTSWLSMVLMMQSFPTSMWSKPARPFQMQGWGHCIWRTSHRRKICYHCRSCHPKFLKRVLADRKSPSKG